MSRRPHSTSPPDSPRLSKKPKLQHLTPENFKNGVFLAPMVRSGACKPLHISLSQLVLIGSRQYRRVYLR
ncbi:hypothetical protein HWV62_11071 [Athelia sp. TMB]|nr:hypothetical protein HWV62_11071 [Athelia sp. TMB]